MLVSCMAFYFSYKNFTLSHTPKKSCRKKRNLPFLQQPFSKSSSHFSKQRFQSHPLQILSKKRHHAIICSFFICPVNLNIHCIAAFYAQSHERQEPYYDSKLFLSCTYPTRILSIRRYQQQKELLLPRFLPLLTDGFSGFLPVPYTGLVS